jgi:starch synthase
MSSARHGLRIKPKGLILSQRFEDLGKAGLAVGAVGCGDPTLAIAKKLQKGLPDRVRVETRYDAKLARQIYGGSDLFLMPSRYEPCGISQMIAMRYGSIPLVRAVGGLHDTVTDSETGFVFVDKKVKSFNDTLRRALQSYPDRSRWMTLQKAGMAQDFSWSNSAKKYLDLYKKFKNETTAPLRTANGIGLREG